MRFVGLKLPEEEKPSFVCPECGASFKSESALKKHMAKEHPGAEAAEKPEGDE